MTASNQPNYPWMRAQLLDFIDQADPTRGHSGVGPYTYRSNVLEAAIVGKAQIVEHVLDLVVPGWKDAGKASTRDHWERHRTAALRAISQIDNQKEIEDNLGDNAPKLSAALLHRWVWESAKSLWRSSHYDQAVNVAAIKVNLEGQQLSGSTLTETDLFNNLFSPDRTPKPNKPRLILPGDDGSQTADSMRRGARSLAEACYALYRNPVAHGIPGLTEQEALEQLAVFSTLARIIEASTVVI